MCNGHKKGRWPHFESTSLCARVKSFRSASKSLQEHVGDVATFHYTLLQIIANSRLYPNAQSIFNQSNFYHHLG